MKTVITVKNWIRPFYYQRVLSSLFSNDLGNIPVFDFVDIKSNLFDSFKTIDSCFGVTTLRGGKGCAGNTRECFKFGFDIYGADFVIHLEDDTIVSPDFIDYMLWCRDKYINNTDIFIITAYNFRRDSYSQGELNKVSIRKPTRTFLAWGMYRRIWEEVKDDWFGTEWKCGLSLTDIPEGEEFLKLINKTDEGCWGWMMLKYHCRGRKEVYPLVSRCQNIGVDNGRFNPSGKWFYENVYTRAFNENEVIKDFEEIVCE